MQGRVNCRERLRKVLSILMVLVSILFLIQPDEASDNRARYTPHHLIRDLAGSKEISALAHPCDPSRIQPLHSQLQLKDTKLARKSLLLLMDTPETFTPA